MENDMSRETGRIDARSPGFEPDMRISLESVYVVLLIAAAALMVTGALAFDPSASVYGPLLGLIVLAVLAIAWRLDSWSPIIARWLVVLLSGTGVFLASRWLPLTGFLVLMALVVALAAVLINLRAATIVAAGATVLISLSMSHLGVDAGTGVTSVIAVWGTLAIMCAAYHPVFHIVQWSWDLYQHAGRVLQETQDQRVEMQSTLESLAHANRNLALANERISALYILAQDAEKAKAEFVARVSHEFRTPLNIIIGMVDLMVETPETYAEELPPDLREDLQIVQRNCKHLAGMINDVLDLSQAEAGQLVIRREEQDLAEIIESALAVVRPLIEKKKLSLEVVVPEDLPKAQCDRMRIRQVILNLISNAARYTETGGIKVFVSRQDDRVVLGVSDTGPGITSEEADAVFRPFFRGANPLSSGTVGSGLGLSISKRFVEHHGGRMWVESRPGMGSIFYFDLPFAPPAAPVARPDQWIREDWIWHEEVSRQTPAAARLQLTRPRVVVCDATGNLYHAFARCSDDVEFVRTQNPQEAVQETKRCPAHALAINMATADDLWPSIDALRRQVQDTPIVACSVIGADDWAVRAGALGYLTKPVLRAQLQEAIHTVGRRITRVLLVDDDPDACQLWTRMLQVIDSSMEIVAVSGGQQALLEMRSRRPDLVLLDMMMPEMNGRQVLECMRLDEALRVVPVFLVSAQDPGDQPLASSFVLATVAQGLSISKLLRCSLSFSTLLLKPDEEPDRVPG